MGFPAEIYLILQGGLKGSQLPPTNFSYLGTRGLVGIVMLSHMFFAQLFIGYAIGSPLFQVWGRRVGNPRMQRLASAMARFNVLTFSFGATLAGMFLVLLVGFYPRVAAVLFTRFFWFVPVIAMISMGVTIYAFYFYHYRTQHRSIAAGVVAALAILLWQTLLTSMDTYMTTGGGPGAGATASGSSLGSAWSSIWNPMFVPLDIHRTFANLSWPAYAIAGWAAFMYARAKKEEDKKFFDWAGSMGVVWGTGFLLLQPFAGFAVAYSLKSLGWTPANSPVPGTGGPYERLTGTGAGSGSFASHMLYINLFMVVLLFVFSNAAMYLGAVRHPERRGRSAIRAYALVAVVAGAYSVSPIAMFPVFWARYIAMFIMVIATLGSLVVYVRGRRLFEYGSPGGAYRASLMALGVLAATVALGMGLMKSNSRDPYTIYGQPQYRVHSTSPVNPQQVRRLPSGG